MGEQRDGDRAAGGISIEGFSDCVGAIYDCAVDPAAWPVALERICGLVRGMNGVVIMVDTQGGSMRLQRAWNVDEESARLFATEYAHDNPLTPLFAAYGVDEPYNVPAVMPVADWENSRLYREFAVPRGYGDSVGVTLIRSPSRLASLSVARARAFDYCGPEELKMLGLLAPHARRALMISDMMEMRSIVAEGLEAALEELAPGVVLVDASGRAIFANRAARDRGGLRPPLSLAGGRVSVSGRAAEAAFQALLADARAGHLRATTLGVRMADGEVAFIHALPIDGGGARTQLMDKASHALFVTRRPEAPELSRDAWAGSFGLTAMETSVLDRLVAGIEPAEIARLLGIAMPTVRTHLSSLFQKTGTTRQAELVKLAASLQPPVG